MARAQSGPLPPRGDLPDPAILQAYKDISPAYADTVLAVFASMAEHQRKMQEDALKARVAYAFRRQVFSLITWLTFIAVGLIVVMYGHEWPAVIFTGGGLAGLVSGFVLGHKRKLKRSRSPQPRP